jgi:antibiotic biosynthesis monooxygenase (ABM) superfamily enzyme
MIEAIEITTFKLVKGCTCEKFIATNQDIDRWLERQPGFRSRRIAQRNDGTIVDMLLWASTDDAESAMHRLMDELQNSPVHALIDQHTVLWTVAPVFHSINK